MRHNNTARQHLVNTEETTLRAVSDAPAIETIARYLKSNQAPWMLDKAEATIRKRRWAIDRHIIPHFGDRDLFELTRREVITWHHKIAKDVSAYTARATLATLRLAFRHITIEFEGRIPRGWADPTELPSTYKVKEAPRNVGRVQYMDKQEAALFIWSPKLEFSRRLFYALLAYTGMRVGEVSALTWADYNPDMLPLGEFRVSKTYGRSLRPTTKTGVTKLIPVHPLLAEMLKTWKATGWEKAFGRAPKPDDTLIPRLVRGEIDPESETRQYKICHMGANAARERWLIDRGKLGLDLFRTTIHGWRGSFLSWAEDGGIRREIAMRITHTGRRDVVDGYITKNWPELCDVVMAIDLPMPDEARPTYDIHGYDVDGFNADGWDRQGFDREGFSAEGWDRQGYDRQGFNKDGVDRVGLFRGIQRRLFND